MLTFNFQVSFPFDSLFPIWWTLPRFGNWGDEFSLTGTVLTPWSGNINRTTWECSSIFVTVYPADSVLCIRDTKSGWRVKLSGLVGKRLTGFQAVMILGPWSWPWAMNTCYRFQSLRVLQCQSARAACFFLFSDPSRSAQKISDGITS